MPNPDHIDPELCISFKKYYKCTWKQVGVMLAGQQQRDEPYRADSIRKAVSLFKRFRWSTNDERSNYR